MPCVSSAVKCYTAVLWLAGVTDVYRGYELCNVRVEHVQDAIEIVSFGGGYVLPIVGIDTGNGMKTVGEGKPGPFFRALQQLVTEDFSIDDHVDPVPYHVYEK